MVYKPIDDENRFSGLILQVHSIQEQLRAKNRENSLLELMQIDGRINPNNHEYVWEKVSFGAPIFERYAKSNGHKNKPRDYVDVENRLDFLSIIDNYILDLTSALVKCQRKEQKKQKH